MSTSSPRARRGGAGPGCGATARAGPVGGQRGPEREREEGLGRVGSEEHLLLGRDHIRESLGGLTFQVSASSFFQTNTVQAERLFAVVEAACGLDGGETSWISIRDRRDQPPARAPQPVGVRH